MTTFRQWQAAGCPVRKATWVCGAEPVLAEEVVSAVRASFTGLDRTVLVTGEDREGVIWDTLAQYPIDPVAGRLVVVRGAERLTKWDVLPSLLAAGTSTVVFVSAEEDYARKAEGGKRELLPRLRPFRDLRSAQLVKCVVPEDGDLATWVTGRWPGVHVDVADHLLTRCGGDLAAVRDVAAKAQAARLPATRATVDGLVAQRPAARFTDALLARQRGEAVTAAAALDPASVPGVLTHLDYTLDVLLRLNEALSRRLDGRDIAIKYRIPAYLARKYRDVAPRYVPRTVQASRASLAQADNSWRRGARTGVMEVLAATW